LGQQRISGIRSFQGSEISEIALASSATGAVLPDSGVHRYFAQIKRNFSSKSGEVLLAVSLSF
jgi:hypothetical protein